MTERDPGQMRRLLHENALRRRSAELTRQWSALGVSVARISHEQHRTLIFQMRAGTCLSPFEPLIDIDAEIRAFAGSCDLVTVMGCSASTDPALFVSLLQFLRHLSEIETIYRDGFIIFDQSRRKALHIDFDDVDGVQYRRMTLPASGA